MHGFLSRTTRLQRQALIGDAKGHGSYILTAWRRMKIIKIKILVVSVGVLYVVGVVVCVGVEGFHGAQILKLIISMPGRTRVIGAISLAEVLVVVGSRPGWRVWQVELHLCAIQRRVFD